MPTDPAPAAPFRVRHDDVELPIDFDPADYPTAADVVAHVAAYDNDYDVMLRGIYHRFEVWRHGAMVATARRDEASGEYIPNPPFDRSRGMSPRTVEGLDRFFPGVLDKPGPG